MYKGLKSTNDAYPLVSEYSQRRRLAKLGYTSNISELSAWKASVFVMIDSEIDRLESEEMKKKRQKNGRR